MQRLGKMKTKSDNEPLYKQIKDHLNGLIQQNFHNPKYRLPSENQLATQFGTSRIPVIQAMRELEEEGKIRRIQGSGSFIKTDFSEQANPEMKFALLIPQVHSHYCLEMIDGIQDFLKQHNIMLHICITGDDPEQEKAYIDSVRALHFHGILLFPVLRSTYSNTILKLTISKFPVVFIGRNMPHLDVSSTLCDPFDQAFRAVEYLHKKGHKNIVFITESPKDEFFYEKRCQGYKSAMQFYYQNADPTIAEIDFYDKDNNTQNNISDTVFDFMDKNPDADAIITSDLGIVPIVRYLIQKGENANKPTIMVFDTAKQVEYMQYQNLVVIDQNPHQIGYRAAEQLYLQITDNAPIKNISIPETIIEKY